MSEQQHHQGPGYSTLEVASFRDDGSTLPEVMTERHSPATEKIYHDQSHASEYDQNHTSAYDQNYAMANAYDASQGLEHVPPPQETNQAGTRICGLSRKMFWIVLVIALLLIGGIAGGVAGGLASRKSANSADSSASPTTSSTSSPTSTSSPSSTSTTGSSPGALANSQIAALNWTDSDNLLRRAIFYQHNGALLFSQYHTANSSWTQFNISAVFESETSADALNVKAGTPLAVAAVSLDDVNFLRDTEGISAFVASLYFIDSSNHLRELYSRDFDLATWSQGDLKDASLVAADGSHISALAYYCPRLTDAGPTDANCTDQFVITYQNSNGEVMKADGPNWNSPQTVDRAYENSSIAIIPLASGEGRNTFDVSEMRIFYYSDNVIDFMYWNYYGLMEGNTIMTSQNVVNNEIPQIVATPCDSHGRAMVMAMTGASKFTASFYDYNYTSQWRTDQSVQFNNQNGGSTSGSPDTNLTSIAMDQNGSLYGISSDGKTVIAYSWSSNTAVRYYLSWKENIVIE